jgi:hypothetical protein
VFAGRRLSTVSEQARGTVAVRVSGLDQELQRRAERAGANQSIFRSVNERVEELNRAMPVDDPLREFICECAGQSCFDRIELSFAEYEQLRSHPARFAVAPSDEHLVRGVEVVVECTDRYWVVEKLGEAGEVAEDADPRDPEA